MHEAYCVRRLTAEVQFFPCSLWQLHCPQSQHARNTVTAQRLAGPGKQHNLTLHRTHYSILRMHVPVWGLPQGQGSSLAAENAAGKAKEPLALLLSCLLRGQLALSQVRCNKLNQNTKAVLIIFFMRQFNYTARKDKGP